MATPVIQFTVLGANVTAGIPRPGMKYLDDCRFVGVPNAVQVGEEANTLGSVEEELIFT